MLGPGIPFYFVAFGGGNLNVFVCVSVCACLSANTRTYICEFTRDYMVECVLVVFSGRAESRASSRVGRRRGGGGLIGSLT